MKKTWATINETLNRSKNTTAFPSNFMINNLSVEDPQEIANHFNIFFIDVGSDLSNKKLLIMINQIHRLPNTSYQFKFLTSI